MSDIFVRIEVLGQEGVARRFTCGKATQVNGSYLAFLFFLKHLSNCSLQRPDKHGNIGN